MSWVDRSPGVTDENIAYIFYVLNSVFPNFEGKMPDAIKNCKYM